MTFVHTVGPAIKQGIPGSFCDPSISVFPAPGPMMPFDALQWVNLNHATI